MSDETHAYLHVKIQLVRGKQKVFEGAMGEMAPVLETYGWFLVGAFTPAIGRLYAVYHVWRVPSADGEVVERGIDAIVGVCPADLARERHGGLGLVPHPGDLVGGPHRGVAQDGDGHDHAQLERVVLEGRDDLLHQLAAAVADELVG